MPESDALGAFRTRIVEMGAVQKHPAQHIPETEDARMVEVCALLRSPDGARARVYFGAGMEAFPPKSVYPFDWVGEDVRTGWIFEAALHNHPLQVIQEAHRLGVPAPSTSDVTLSRALAESMGLERVLVTNGFYTMDLPTSKLGGYLGTQGL